MRDKLDLRRMTQSVEVARLFYIEDMDQKQIAERLDMSRPTVSRLLQYAKDNSIVQVNIHNPFGQATVLSEQLSEKYDQYIQVAPDNYDNQKDALQAVAAYTANYLLDNVKAGMTIGVGWGRTLHAVADQLMVSASRDEYIAPENISTVQLKGSVSLSYSETFAYQIINTFASVFHTQPEYLPLPTIFDEVSTKEIVEADRHMSRILELGSTADVTVFSVGTVRKKALLFELEYLNDTEKTNLRKHAVGDIVSRFIDKDGAIVDPELNERTVGIQLDALKEVEHSILVAAGSNKAKAVNATLKGGYAKQVFIDTLLAQSLLNL